MEIAGDNVFYEDVLTIVEPTPEKGIWRARGARNSWLPILVHSTCVRASGFADLSVDELKRAIVCWRPKYAQAFRLWSVSHVVSSEEMLAMKEALSRRPATRMLTLAEIDERLKLFPDSSLLKLMREWIVKTSRDGECE
jgi:hypothetical protein